MPLESAVYISDLNASNPATTDLVQKADDHIRLIKSALKATFPNITGPVTVTQDQLNGVVPIGVISLWYGSSGSVPSGWALCNGQTVSRTDGAGTIVTPNLVNKIVMGAGSTVAQGASAGALTSSGTTATGGSHTHTVTSTAHTHGVTVDGTALTEAQMPAHNHGNGVGDSTSVAFGYGTKAFSSSSNMSTGSGSGTLQGLTETVGGGQTHTHTASTAAGGGETMTTASHAGHTHTFSGVSILPPVYGLHYIMKV